MEELLCPQRIQGEVPGELQEGGILVHDQGLGATLKQMPDLVVAGVEPPGVNPVELTHTWGEVSLFALEVTW